MRRNALLSSERGIALPVALFALVVIGTLVAGVFFTARLEMRGGESAMSATRATEAAQGGLMMGVPNALTVGANLTNGTTASSSRAQIGTSGSYYQYHVTRLNRYVYLVRSVGEYEGRSGVILARRTMAYIVKRYMPEVDINSGAIVVGNAVVSGSADLDGHDVAPPGWTCPAGTDQPGLRTNGTATLSGSGSVEGTGTPPYTTGDTTVTNMSRIMDTMFFQLAAQANVKVASNVTVGPNPATTGTCVRTDSLNWGDPRRNGGSPYACETYYPIVLLSNNVSTTTFTIHGDGQGVLLVNGNLRFNGNSHYAGLILVRGSFQGGTGNISIDGTLISLNADLTTDNIQGNIDLDYSSCAVKEALNNLSVTAPATYRGFMQF